MSVDVQIEDVSEYGSSYMLRMFKNMSVDVQIEDVSEYEC
jgi:hypothetical protein